MAIVFRGGPELVTRSRDGHHFTMVEAKEIISSDGSIYQMPIGAVSDGASIPQELWSTGLAPFGTYWAATFVHDLAYRGTLLRQTTDGQWLPAMMLRDQSDFLLMDAMISLGVDEVQRGLIYDGVRLCGWRAFRDDRSETKAPVA